MKKAQGALEFLMTYGWAFLVILIMIGALASFGVLNPSKFLPDKCQFGTEISCKRGEFIINNDVANTIVAKIVNNFGYNVKIYDAKVTSDVSVFSNVNCITIGIEKAPESAGQEALFYNINNPDPANAVSWKEGEAVKLIMDCATADGLVEGDKVKLQIAFKWFPATSDASFSHTMNGEIFSAVQ